MLFVCCTVVNYAQNTGGGAGTTATKGASKGGGVSDGQVIRSAASQKRAGADCQPVAPTGGYTPAVAAPARSVC